MESGAALDAGTREAVAAVVAAAVALAASPGVDAGRGGPSGPNDVSVADAVRDVDPLRCLADACLDGLAEVARLEARTAALKVWLSRGYARAAEALAPPAASPQERTAQEMAVVAEVACVLTVSERTAGALVSESLALTTVAAADPGGPAGRDDLLAARPDPRRRDHRPGPAAAAAALEAHFLDPDAPDPARGCPAGELVPRPGSGPRPAPGANATTRSASKNATPEAPRTGGSSSSRTGTAWPGSRRYLPADTAAGIWDRTTAAARALQGPDESRTLPQLRADVAATWLLTNGTGHDAGARHAAPAAPRVRVAGGGVPSPRAQVLVTVPVLSLLGATEEPAVLDGYGPIPPSMARRLVADGADSFYRVLIDPRDGAPLEIGRTSYRLTKAQRQWLRLRDGRCPFPGCNNPSLDNDADHLLAWADGGTTGITNLGQPCRKHHRLKHASAWTPAGASKNHPPGWTSPVRTALPQRTPGLGTTPLARPHPRGHPAGSGR